MRNPQAQLSLAYNFISVYQTKKSPVQIRTCFYVSHFFLIFFFPLAEAFFSVCCTFPQSGGSGNYIQQYFEWSFPAGWLQFWCESLGQHTGPGCHLPASENEPELPAHSHSVSLHFQPQRHI